MQVLVASFVILIISIINFTKPRDENENRSQTDPTRPLSSYQIMQCRCLHLATKRFLLSSITAFLYWLWFYSRWGHLGSTRCYRVDWLFSFSAHRIPRSSGLVCGCCACVFLEAIHLCEYRLPRGADKQYLGNVW